MRPSEALVRFIVGGSLITLISFLGTTRYKIFSGILVLFPIVTVVGYYFLSLEVSNSELQSTVLFSILAVPTVLAFLAGFYFALDYTSAPLGLVIGIGVWLIVAAIIALIDHYYIGLGNI